MATTEERLSSLEQQVSAVTAKLDTFIGEMRDRDNQRAAEIIELRQRQDADRKELNAKIDALGTQINDTWRQTMIGVGGMIIAVGALLVALLK